MTQQVIYKSTIYALSVKARRDNPYKDKGREDRILFLFIYYLPKLKVAKEAASTISRRAITD